MNGEGEKRDIVFHLHLLSDATGETLNAIAKAAAAQFETAKPIEHVHPLVRTKRQLERALAEIERAPGLVLYTLMSPDLRTMLEERLDVLGMPAHSVLDGTISIFRQYLGMEASDRPGGQHELDQRYFARIAALNFTMAHDDGQGRLTIDGADVILVGVSRTSKTPTCIY
ncbi:MAG TPA: kinase/pyrophosphorylase, partial [Micropepsaceae bacterium]|nr:kinase/pyrophosphorylase [Micropepsaceae bacterium]